MASPLVTDLCRDYVRIQQNANFNIKEKVVLYAHQTNDEKLTKSVLKQLQNWHDCSWPVIVIDSSDIDLTWPEYVTVLRKPNIGYDFGSWAVALEKFPEIFDSKKVLFANSGVIGPFWSFSNLLRDFEESNSDFWGLTDNSDIDWHIQTYWFGFSNETLSRSSLKEFWSGVRVTPTKSHVVVDYEVGLSRVIRKNKYSTRVVFPYKTVGVADGIDTGTYAWDRLLDMGLPFLKRRVLQWVRAPMIDKVRTYGNDAVDLVMEGLSEHLS